MSVYQHRRDIPDDVVLAAIQRVQQTRGVSVVSRWDIAAVMLEDITMVCDVPDGYTGVPEKLLLAKLRHMVDRRLILGCACGCRGDFELPPVDMVGQVAAKHLPADGRRG